MRTLRPAPAIRPAFPTAPAAPAPCPNCGAAAGAYCPACGQAQRDFHRSVRTFARELFDTFSGWDGKMPGTFRLMLTRPGALTREFLAGHRVRYLSPLRLYFLASVPLFFALRTSVSWTPMPVHVDYHASAAGATADGTRRREVDLWIGAVKFGMTRAGPYAGGDSGRHSGPPTDRSWSARVARGAMARLEEVFSLPATAASAELERSFVTHLATTLLLLVPVFAFFCQLLWRRARLLFYAEHMVFSLHANAQGLLAFTLVRFAPGVLWLAPVAWTAAYLWLGARRVYGVGHESRAATTAKVVALGVGYAVALALGLLITFLISFFFRG